MTNGSSGFKRLFVVSARWIAPGVLAGELLGSMVGVAAISGGASRNVPPLMIKHCPRGGPKAVPRAVWLQRTHVATNRRPCSGTDSIPFSQRMGRFRLHLRRDSLVVCRAQSPPGGEVRSPPSIALELHQRYRTVVDRGCSGHLKEFVEASVSAYSLGCSEEGVRQELLSRGRVAAGEEQRWTPEEVEECVLWMALVSLTVMCAPQPCVVRWATAPAVSPEVLLQWRGFCALIANAYYTQGMAWFPVQRLQMEQLAVTGRAEDAALVSDRMRIVFATLEVVDPRWGSRQDLPPA